MKNTYKITLDPNRKETNKFSEKQINRIVRPVITLIIAGVLLLMLPVLSGVVAVPFFLFGQHIAYIVSRFIQNLYGPLIIIILITVFPLVLRIIFAVRTGGSQSYKLSLKDTVLILFLLVFGIYATAHSLKNIANLILDVGVVATADYAEADGQLELYEALIGDDHQTFMEIDGIKFGGGNVQAGDLIEGDEYHVEYLPNTKYVVKYQRKE